MLGVVNEVPVPRLVPPVAAAYQLMVPADAVAPRVTVPVPHCLQEWLLLLSVSIYGSNYRCPGSSGTCTGCCIDIISCCNRNAWSGK